MSGRTRPCTAPHSALKIPLFLHQGLVIYQRNGLGCACKDQGRREEGKRREATPLLESTLRHPALVQALWGSFVNGHQTPHVHHTGLHQHSTSNAWIISHQSCEQQGKHNEQAEVIFSNIGINQTNCSPTRAGCAPVPWRRATTWWIWCL